jgi:hypothetical protein
MAPGDATRRAGPCHDGVPMAALGARFSNRGRGVIPAPLSQAGISAESCGGAQGAGGQDSGAARIEADWR